MTLDPCGASSATAEASRTETALADSDEREDPCPECDEGEVVSVGRMERETGDQPYACNASCGYYG